MNRFYLLLLLAIISCFFVSCQSEEEQRMEVAQIVQSRPTQDLLNELYLASDGEIESLARILQVTPSSIERIRKGETEATTQFDDKIRSIVTYYYQNDRKFSLLQSALDDEYSWYDSVLNFPSHHPFAFWTINIILLLALAFATLIAIWPVLIEMLIFLVAWLACSFYSPDAIEDNYVDTINPAIEQTL